MVGLEHYLTVAAVLFVIGMGGMLLRRTPLANARCSARISARWSMSIPSANYGCLG